MVENIILYSLAIIALVYGFFKDKDKSIKALKKSWKAFENILPEFITIVVIVGIILSFLDTATISNLIGNSSGWVGVILSSAIGAITLIPGFVAFPMSAILLVNGAGYMQIAAFISSLMMVGVVTFSVEKSFFGAKVTFIRNLLAFAFSFVVALVIGWVMNLG